MTTDDLGDRMKAYEQEWARQVPTHTPIVIRLDGKNFSRWTRGLRRPMDPTLRDVMVESTEALVAETGALIGYTQSDEITLVLRVGKSTEAYFNGKTQKLASVTASFLTATFNRAAWRRGLVDLTNLDRPFATFDARVFAVPDIVEASNAVLWRIRDAVKNGITSVARLHASHVQLHGVSQDDRLAIIAAAGDSMENYDVHLRFGTMVRRTFTKRPFTTHEIDALPPKHHARTDPSLCVERSIMERLDAEAFLRASTLDRLALCAAGEKS